MTMVRFNNGYHPKCYPIEILIGGSQFRYGLLVSGESDRVAGNLTSPDQWQMRTFVQTEQDARIGAR